MTTKEKIVKNCFILYGIMMATGVPFVFIPNSAMVSIGEWCKLPAFEITPVFEYMARGMSFLSFLFGVVMFYLAFHLEEERKFIRFMGWVGVCSILVAAFVHLKIDFPWWFKVGDLAGLISLIILCFLVPSTSFPKY